MAEWEHVGSAMDAFLTLFLFLFISLTKELEEQRQEIQRLQGEHSKLQSIIKNLERDIIGLKKEVTERDETINEKVRRN